MNQVLLIDYDLLSRTDLQLIDKVVYSIICREFKGTRLKFTSRLTDSYLSVMTAVSQSSIQRSLRRLVKKKLIGIATQTSVRKRGSATKDNPIKSSRWIYLDRKLAGQRQAKITREKNRKIKRRRPLQWDYMEQVLLGNMPKEQFVCKRHSERFLFQPI